MKQRGGVWKDLKTKNCRGHTVILIEDEILNKKQDDITKAKEIVEGILGKNALIKDYFRLVLQKKNIEEFKNPKYTSTKEYKLLVPQLSEIIGSLLKMNYLDDQIIEIRKLREYMIDYNKNIFNTENKFKSEVEKNLLGKYNKIKERKKLKISQIKQDLDILEFDKNYNKYLFKFDIDDVQKNKIRDTIFYKIYEIYFPIRDNINVFYFLSLYHNICKNDDIQNESLKKELCQETDSKLTENYAEVFRRIFYLKNALVEYSEPNNQNKQLIKKNNFFEKYKVKSNKLIVEFFKYSYISYDSFKNELINHITKLKLNAEIDKLNRNLGTEKEATKEATKEAKEAISKVEEADAAAKKAIEEKEAAEEEAEKAEAAQKQAEAAQQQAEAVAAEARNSSNSNRREKEAAQKAAETAAENAEAAQKQAEAARQQAEAAKKAQRQAEAVAAAANNRASTANNRAKAAVSSELYALQQKIAALETNKLTIESNMNNLIREIKQKEEVAVQAKKIAQQFIQKAEAAQEKALRAEEIANAAKNAKAAQQQAEAAQQQAEAAQKKAEAAQKQAEAEKQKIDDNKKKI